MACFPEALAGASGLHRCRAAVQPGPAMISGYPDGPHGRPVRAAGLAWPGWAGFGGGRSGGQRPAAVAAGQAPADQVAQVQRGGAALEPGVVPGHAAVAELDPASRKMATWAMTRSTLGR
jgi:hypothetical protein